MATVNMTIEDMEVFRDNFSMDEAVLAQKAPRFYHYVLNGNDVVYDTQDMTGSPYTVSPGLTFEAFLLDNEVALDGSRALIKGIKLNRVEADAFGIAKIVEWLDNNKDAVKFSEKLRR